MDRLPNLNREILTAFKLSGFLIKSETCSFLANQLLLAGLNPEEKEKWIDKITENIQHQKLTSQNIEKTHVETALNEINRVGLDRSETVFSVINAYDVPRFKFNIQRKKFELDNSLKSYFPTASKKATYLRDRYTILHQKTLRHELFSPVIEGTSAHVKKFKLYYVENMLSASKIDEVVVLGLLTQLTEGKFFIEDPSGVVPLDLSQARFHSGFFCEGSFVLAEGKYSDGVLKVAGLGFPPPEPAKSSRAFYGTQNSWGGNSNKLLKYSPRLLEIEQSNTEATIVVLSDVRLDNPIVIKKLRQLFLGYDDCPPIAIILMGPFSKTDEDIRNIKQLFQGLGDLMNNCDRLKQDTDLILVPSSEDPAGPNILPRPSLPAILLKTLTSKIPRAIFSTNPCRLQYCTQQIVVCRADLVTKLCRNTLHFPENGQLEDYFARTLICQGTLAPINPIALPIYWDYDAALSLYPLPDLVIIGDPSQPFTTTQHDCTIVNTGSFVKSKFSFKVYIPSTKTIEDSAIPDDDE